MQAGDYTTTGVPEMVRRRVFVNGVHRHHVSDSWSAEIASDLPDQVSGVTGIRARTGSVTFAPVTTVVDEAPSPLRRADNWPPSRGDELTIFDETDTQRWRRATARVVDVRAGLGAGEIDVDWSDDLDSSLSQTTELPPVANRMPGTEVLESGVLKRHWHRTGIEPWGIVVEALEDANFRLLPSLPSVDLYALFQGNAHPRVGRIQQAYSTGNLFEWDNTSGFQYLAQWSYFTPGYNSPERGEYLALYLRGTEGGPTAQTRWTMDDGSEVRLLVSSSSAILSHHQGGTSRTLVQMGFSNDSPLPWVGVHLSYTSAVIWTQDGTQTAQFWDDPLGSISWDRVRVLGAAAVAASYQPRSGWPGFNWPSLRYRSTGPHLVREPVCVRSIEPTKVRDVLDDIAKSTLTGYWLNEHGVMQWAPSSVLETRTPLQTITTRMDVLAGSWTETGGGVASSVVTKYEEAALTTSSMVKVVVGESGSGRTMDHGDVEEQFVGPGADEEWIEPDMTPLSASQNADTSYKEARFSVWGGSYVATEGETAETTTYGWAQDRGWLSIQIDPLTPRQWKVTHRVGANSAGTGAPQVQLVTLPGEGTQLPIPWRDKALPIWRARGRASFVDANYTSRLGPAWAPAYEHDLGAWGSRQDARRVGDWLGQRMSTIQVVLSQLSVIPDPRRQLGDVIEVNAQGVLGGVLRCLIVGIHESSTAEGIEQSLDLRVIRATAAAEHSYRVFESSASSYAGPESRGTYQNIEEA